MIGRCPYICNNKTSDGWCSTTVCINPLYTIPTSSMTYTIHFPGEWKLLKPGYFRCICCNLEISEKDARWMKYCPICGSLNEVILPNDSIE